jgi:hypothetical protein
MRHFLRSVLPRLCLTAYMLWLLSYVRDYHFNALADLRALWQPYSLDETWQCLVASRGGLELLTDADANGLQFVLDGDTTTGDRGMRQVIVVERTLPVLLGGQYNFPKGEVVLNDHPLITHLMGCDERAADLAHEMQHALDAMGGPGFGWDGEIRAFRRAQAVRNNTPFQDTHLSAIRRLEIEITYALWRSLV